MNALRKLGSNIFSFYVKENFSIINECLEKDKEAVFLDLGSGEGKYTKKVAKRIGTKYVYAVDAVKKDITYAKKLRIAAKVVDLNEKLPYRSSTFDVLLSHYSIEHLVNIRSFVRECYRILKPGGYMIVASDNLNSWLNIIAMIFGLQPFSLTRGLSNIPVGNPFAYWTNEETGNFVDRDNKALEGAGSHIKVMSTRAAEDVFMNQGFTVENLKGAGYFPFIGIVSSFLSNVDPYHAHFWIFKLRKE